MGAGGRGDARVLVVYGSESGSAKRGISKIAGKWKAAGVNIVKIVEGNTVASQVRSDLKDNYDVVVVATSSFGEGDPPSNFNLFLLELMRGSAAGDKPLAGAQHVVLGYGASVYETFQNTPRLADKFLEECGSRRMAMRVELDEGMEDDGESKLASFERDVLKLLQALPEPKAPAACDWRKPDAKILEKSESDLTMDAFEGGGSAGVVLGLAGVAAAVAAGYAYYTGMISF